MKPTPAKPRIIIAQVEGSGTASMVTGVIVPVKLPVPTKVRAVTKAIGLLGSRPRLGSIPKTSNWSTPRAPKSNSVLAARVLLKTQEVPFQRYRLYGVEFP